MSVIRWRFYNPRTLLEYVVPINPNQMTSPHGPRDTIGYTVSPIDQQVRARRNHKVPHEWQFAGVIRTQEHHDALRDWCASPDLIEVSDHLGRTFQVRLFSFEPVERRPTPHVPWRFRYVVRCYVHGRLA
jgi:hypothetical protein